MNSRLFQAALLLTALLVTGVGLAGCVSTPSGNQTPAAPAVSPAPSSGTPAAGATTVPAAGSRPPAGGQAGPDTSWVSQRSLDIPYANLSSAEKLDVYLPNAGTGPFPVIVAIHGGAFMMGDKADGQLTPMLEGLNRGYAVVSVNYRLSSEAAAPAQINDVKAAIRWVRANAAQCNLDPDRIAAWGGSAGGYLAALAGTSGDVAALEDLSQGNPGQSSRVQAVVDLVRPDQLLGHGRTVLTERARAGQPQPGRLPGVPAVRTEHRRGAGPGEGREPRDVHHRRRPALLHPARDRGLAGADPSSRSTLPRG